MSDPVVMALHAALKASDDVQLRVALGTRKALCEFEHALELDASDVSALDGAVRASTAPGDTARSHAYQLARAVHVGAGVAELAAISGNHRWPRARDRKCRGLA